MLHQFRCVELLQPSVGSKGPYTFVWLDAMTQRCRREGGHVVNVVTAIATGVNGNGHREILGIDVFTSEDEAGWKAFLHGLVARGLSGVKLVTSDLAACIGKSKDAHARGLRLNSHCLADGPRPRDSHRLPLEKLDFQWVPGLLPLMVMYVT